MLAYMDQEKLSGQIHPSKIIDMEAGIMRLLAEDCVTLVVDYQEKLMPVINDHEQVEKRSEILLKGLKTLGIPSIVTQQYTKGIGMTIPSITQAAENDSYFDKISFSCFEDEEIRKTIFRTGKKNVIVCGIEAHICVLQTCIDLKAAGYTPVLVTDCIGSRKASDKEIALLRAQSEGIILTTSEAVLFELTRKAGSEAFKVISKLIK